jgi:Tol biopolymer transport system component
MRICALRILCAAVATCVLRLGSTETCTLGFGILGAARAQPIEAHRQVADEPDRRLPERFMVIDGGCALLGQEKERLESSTGGWGTISPDGRWALFNKFDVNPPPGKRQGELVIQSRVRPTERTTVPLVWGTTGSSFLPIWSSDGDRILICEQGAKENVSRGSACRVYKLSTKSLTELKVPNEWWPSDWSADGKRVLTSLRTEDDAVRVAWVNTDGTGQPEFITSDQEVAYGAKLSRDGQRILCMVGPKTPKDESTRTRLFVIDLATKKQTMVGKPGHTHGYCWSSDGLKVAYTWQMPLRQPVDSAERKTYLITCDPDGSNQKTITMRQRKVPQNSSAREGVSIFFQVVAWWR